MSIRICATLSRLLAVVALLIPLSSAADPALVAATLPASRSVTVGTQATAFATVINAGIDAGEVCSIALSEAIGADFYYQATDPATNLPVGTADAPVTIDAGAAQTFVFGVTPNVALTPTNLALVFDCDNSSPAPSQVGINTLLLSAANSPVPDIVALAATLERDGIVRLDQTTRAGVFAVAVINLGLGGAITASADTGQADLGVEVAICETDPANGTCLSPPTPSVTTTIGGGATPTFGVFPLGTGPVAFDPSRSRVFVRFTDAGGVTRGSTSVALRDFPPPTVPANQFNIGDSIGQGEAADGVSGMVQPERVWSTGYDATDAVLSLNERFKATYGDNYYENDSSRDHIFNHAESGAQMNAFSTQAQAVVAATQQTQSGSAGQVSILLGNNDVCAADIASMTDIGQFEAEFRAGLDVLAGSGATRSASIHVAGIPAIYWLWESKRTNSFCRNVAWLFVPCENLLDNPDDDCESAASREDPDAVYAGDGPDCRRRKQFHALIRDSYNPVLRDVTDEYRGDGRLPDAAFIDMFDVRFDANHVNNGDCFHPSEAGQALLAEKQYCRSKWGAADPACGD